jgi:subtilisin family serine protease
MRSNLPLSGTYEYAATGAGVTAYIIDTGINAGHSDFGGRVGAGYDAVGDGNDSFDCDGHGTHVVPSDWIGSSTATNTISGTSMATPHVTGAAALYLEQHPGSSPAQVTDGLLAAATPGVISYPSGSPNLLLNTGF